MARSYRGIAFTLTGKAALLLDNGEWLVLGAAQGENLVRLRAEEGLPPLPVVEPPEVLPTRDPPGNWPGRSTQTKIELPPSVIRAPLVLWQSTGAAALTCERVSAYPDGFEIELRAEGLLIQDAERPWGPSSRGFWHSADYFERRHDPATEAKRLQRRIEALGFAVTVTEKAASQDPPTSSAPTTHRLAGVTDEFHDDLHAAGPVEQVDDAGHDRVCLVAGDDEVTFGHLVWVGGSVEEGPQVSVSVSALDVAGDVEFDGHAHLLCL